MIRFWQKQRLLFKLITIVLISILITLIVLYFLLSQRMMATTQENEEDSLLRLSRLLANEELVISAAENEQTNDELIRYTDSVNKNFDLDYTVVMTLDSIRLTHPDEELIYKPFQGSDQHAVFTGKEYTSIGEGTLGRSLRAFVPIHNTQNEIVGAVSLGLTTRNLEQIMRRNMQPLTLAFGISLVIGISLATLAAYSLKKQMLDMEPQEIARVLEERNAMMEYAADAVFVTNNKQEVILKNMEATKRFYRTIDSEESLQYIYDVLPFLKDGQLNIEPSKNNEQIYSYYDEEYIVSRAPVIVDRQNVGNVFTLRDATELHELTSQLYSTFEYAHTLEAQSHDFLNKLHVIYGLTDLEAYDELENYLEDLIEPEQEFSKRVAYLIHNPVIAGFLVGERRKFSENQLPFTIEVYPDIPTTDNFRFTQIWIKKVNFINHLLLEASQLIEVHLELGYFDEKILTTYKIRGKTKKIRQQIKTAGYPNSIKGYGNGWLTIYFERPYKKGIDIKFKE
jgi:two-component system CitB family sensor kinase